jgi:hypothetical protein
MRGWEAVSLMFGGIARLIAPHVRLQDGFVRGEKPVLHALPRVGGNLSAALELNGMGLGKDFSSILMGPDFGSVTGIPPSDAMRMAAGSCEFLLRAQECEMDIFDLPARAAQLLARGTNAVSAGQDAKVEQRVAAAKLVLMAERWCRLVERQGGMPMDRGKAARFIARQVSRSIREQGRAAKRIQGGRVK